ncbi:MAG: tetratricopeptide repeat protein [Candidatus Sumerlaeota bacterium]|nr:tetratricopeptide repeat protein [Candidatus Sumerlaeota bacterium]
MPSPYKTLIRHKTPDFLAWASPVLFCAFCIAFPLLAYGADVEKFQIPMEDYFPTPASLMAPKPSSVAKDLAPTPEAFLETEATSAAAETNIPPAFPDPALRRHTEDLASLLSNLAAPAPDKSKSHTLLEREKELEEFIEAMPAALAKPYGRVARAIHKQDWKAAYEEMNSRLQQAPEAPETPAWLFLRAEFLYRDMAQDNCDPPEVMDAFNLFIRAAPDDSVLAPYAFYCMAQVCRRMGLEAEATAYLAATSAAKDTPFDDLFMIYQTQAVIAWNRPAEARKLLIVLSNRYPNSPLKADSEYLLGEMAWSEGSDAGRAASSKHFRNMLDLTTSPLTNAVGRICTVAKSFMFGGAYADAMPLLHSALTNISKTPTPDEGEACLLLAECLYTEGRIKEAIPWYERGENKSLPRRIRLTASLSLAQIGYNQSRLEKPAILSQSQSYYMPLDAAIRIFREATNSDLGAAAGYLWGRILAEKGRLDEAVRSFMIVSSRYPDSPLSSQFKELIESYFQDAIEQAYLKEDYKNVVHFFSANACLAKDLALDRTTRNRHASALLKLGYCTEAANIWRQMRDEKTPDGSTQDTPPPDLLLLNLADSLQKCKQTTEAIQVLRDRQRLFPDGDMAADAFIRAHCYLETNDRSRAINAFEQVLDAPNIAQEDKMPVYESLAKLYEDQQQWGNAEIILQKGLHQIAVAGKPLGQSEIARRMIAALADLYYTQRQTESGVVMYSKYLDLYPAAPDTAMSLFRLGQMQQQRQNYDEAQGIFQRLLESPVDDPIYKTLAKASLADMALQSKMEPQEKKK